MSCLIISSISGRRRMFITALYLTMLAHPRETNTRRRTQPPTTHTTPDPVPRSASRTYPVRISTNIQHTPIVLASVGALFRSDKDATCKLAHRETGQALKRKRG